MISSWHVQKPHAFYWQHYGLLLTSQAPFLLKYCNQKCNNPNFFANKLSEKILIL